MYNILKLHLLQLFEFIYFLQVTLKMCGSRAGSLEAPAARTATRPCIQKGSELGIKVAAAFLKFLTMLEQGAYTFILHWALQFSLWPLLPLCPLPRSLGTIICSCIRGRVVF